MITGTSRVFSRLLIANRGEIAIRIIRAARTLGLETVAVFEARDAKSPHVLAADCAVELDSPLGYRDIGSIIAAARSSGAELVHPGYGFLSENAAFAQACDASGLVFVGPAPETISLMGDKAAARRVMAGEGLPTVPGYDGPDQSDERLLQEAALLGFPLMIKARAGGGGRGLRRVASQADFPHELTASRNESRAAFGDDNVLLERAIDGARHIELQVLADRYGQVFHLGDRDCSVQRRHQKLIEEAPAPRLSAELRTQIAAKVVQALRSTGYCGAGTVEMLLAPDGQWFFMEMNTRLQVEHPVTELVTGEDIVQWQLRIAMGERLPERFITPSIDGHAIEVRLCAENPAHGFLPQTGYIGRWTPPQGVRVEHAILEGAHISPNYDSMLAKIVAHGPDREVARRRLKRALNDLVVLGIPTNRDFLLGCLAHSDFIAAEIDTQFVSVRFAELTQVSPSDQEPLIAVAACLLVPRGAEDSATAHQSALHRGSIDKSSSLRHQYPVPVRFLIDGEVFDRSVLLIGPDHYLVRHGENSCELKVLATSEGKLRVEADRRTYDIHFLRDRAGLWLSRSSRTLWVDDLTFSKSNSPDDRVQGRLGRAPGALTATGQLLAPMTARVSSIQVLANQFVEADQWLLSVEVMKIEHRISAPQAGRIAAVFVSEGEVVEEGAPLLTIVEN